MRELTCIVCPRGCLLKIDENMNVTGNFCPRGPKYAISELTHPMRSLNSSIRVRNRENTLVRVKTSGEIPKEKMFEVMKLINTLSIDAPTKIGDIVAHNPLGLDIDIIVTKKLD